MVVRALCLEETDDYKVKVSWCNAVFGVFSSCFVIWEYALLLTSIGDLLKTTASVFPSSKCSTHSTVLQSSCISVQATPRFKVRQSVVSLASSRIGAQTEITRRQCYTQRL